VLDRTGEWFVREPQAPTATDLDTCFDRLDENADKKQWLLIVSLDNDDAEILAQRLVGVPDIRQGYSYNVGGMALVTPEVDLLVPTSNAPKELRSLWRRGSHAGLSILADTQRPANVSKETTSQCRRLVFFPIYEPNDITYMRLQLGRLYVPAIQWIQGGQYRCVVWDQHDRVLSLLDKNGKAVKIIDGKLASSHGEQGTLTLEATNET
jgi:hypothetical protein